MDPCGSLDGDDSVFKAFLGIVRGEGGGLGWEQSFVMWTIDTSHASSQNAAERERERESERTGERELASLA